MNGGRHCKFSLYCTSAYSAAVSAAGSFALKPRGDVWFMIYDSLGKQTCPACVNLFTVRKKVGALFSELVGQVSSPTAYLFKYVNHTRNANKFEGGSNKVFPNLVSETPTGGCKISQKGRKGLLGDKSGKTTFLFTKLCLFSKTFL